MRTILGLVFILMASPVDAIVVTGEASSFELAQQQAFKKAIDHEVGIIIDTERFAVDKELVHNQILSYSAGYITDYTIISQSETNGVWKVEMDVTVASSILKNFILSQAESIGQFDGTNIKMQIDMYRKQQADGDKLVKNTLKYFPTEAMHIEASEYKIVLDANRNIYLEIPYTLSWNQSYLDALYELLSLFAVEEKTSIYFDFDHGDRLYFNDRVLLTHIKNRMRRADFVTLKINSLLNEPLLNTCVQSILYRQGVGWDGRSTMYGHKGDGIAVYDRVVQNYISVPISSDIYNVLDGMSQIELSVSTATDCPN